MTAACISFEQIEDRAENSLALAIWARRASARTRWMIIGNALLFALAGSLHAFEKVVTPDVLESRSPDELRELSDKIRELTPRLRRMCADFEDHRISRLLSAKTIKRVCESAENLESVYEDVCLALRPEFRQAISSAIDRLELGAEKSAETATMSH